MACQTLASAARPAPLATTVPKAPCARPAAFRSTQQSCKVISGYSNVLCKSSAAAGGASTVVTEEPTTATAAGTGDVWDSFAAAVSGEWEGVTAAFDAEGSPVPLPEYYVPQAYRDWGVELFDWQSQSSMLADAEGLTATNRRMMPTVGCEADAIAFTEEARRLFEAGSASATIAADGSYSWGPQDISGANCWKASYEQCLPLEPAAAQQRRLRVVHNLRRMGAEAQWQLDNVELHLERYDSPYRGKLELSGCGGGMPAFASKECLAVEALQGSWVAHGLRYTTPVTSSTDDAACSRLVVEGESWSADGLQNVLLHPLAAWTSCSISGEDVSLVAGVLLDEAGSSMAVACRRMRAGKLASVKLLRLSRA